MVEAISEAFVVCWSHSLGGSFSGFPLDGFWRDGIVFVAKLIRRRAGPRRGFAMFLFMHIFLQQAFSSLNVSGLLPFGSNKLCISVLDLGLAPL